MTSTTAGPVSTRHWISALMLLAVAIIAGIREFDVLPQSVWLGGFLLLAVVVNEWAELALMSRITVVAALGLAGMFWFTGGLTDPVLMRGLERGVFFSLFVMSMDVLRTAAMSSRMVLMNGKALINQPPGRRYAVITVGGQLFAMLLNVGSLNLLGTMTRRSIDSGQEGVSERVREIRLRRMTLALMRGFTSFTLWAPTSMTVLVVLAALPDFDWYDYAPLGFAVSATYLGFGWLLDRVSWPSPPADENTARFLGVLAGLLPLVTLTVVVLAVAIVLTNVFDLRLVGALLMTVPFFGFGWITWQYNRAGPLRALYLGRRRILRRVLPGMVTLRSEVTMLAAAGFIAGIVPPQIDTVALGGFVSDLGLNGGWVLILMMWLVVVLASFGLNPLISVGAGLEIVARLEGYDFQPLVLAFVGTVSWALSTGTTPFATTLRLTGRSIGREPQEIGLKWNLPFTIYLLLAATVILFFVT